MIDQQLPSSRRHQETAKRSANSRMLFELDLAAGSSQPEADAMDQLRNGLWQGADGETVRAIP